MFKISQYPDCTYHKLTLSVRLCCHGNQSREEVSVGEGSVVFVLMAIIGEEVDLKLA